MPTNSSPSERASAPTPIEPGAKAQSETASPMSACGFWEPGLFYAFDLPSKHLQMAAFDLDKAAGIGPAIKRTTKIANLDTRRAVWRSCHEWVAKVNPAMGLPITATFAVKLFLHKAEGGQYTRSTYLRYRTALLAELGVWIDRCAD